MKPADWYFVFLCTVLVVVVAMLPVVLPSETLNQALREWSFQVAK